MRMFLWKGSKLRGGKGLVTVPWDTVCRPVKLGGLGFLKLQTMNLAVLIKWVSWIMSPKENLVTMEPFRLL